MVGGLRHLVFILAIWRRHRLGVRESSYKKRLSHLEVTPNLQSSGNSFWLLQILAILSSLQLHPLGWDTPMYCGCRDILKSFWLRTTQFTSLGGRLRTFRIFFRNLARSLCSEYSFLESILQVSILT